MSVLKIADNLINGQRQAEYGHPQINMKRIARLWSSYTGTVIRPTDVACMMILLKMARLPTNGSEPLMRNHADTVVDMAGYVGLIELVETGGIRE